MTSPEWLAADEDDADRFPQTPDVSTTFTYQHSCGATVQVVDAEEQPHECSNVPSPDPARVARYAEALRDIDNATLEGTNFGRLTATYDESARAAVAVADEERAALVAEVERLRRGGKTLGEIIDKQCHMVLDATGLHDWVDEDGDGDWGAIWDHLFVLKSRAEAAEAECGELRTRVAEVEALRSKVAKVEAVADDNGTAWADEYTRAESERTRAEAGVEKMTENYVKALNAAVERGRAAETEAKRLSADFVTTRGLLRSYVALSEHLESKVSKVRALADRYRRNLATATVQNFGQVVANDLDLVLADAPAEQRDEGGA